MRSRSLLAGSFAAALAAAVALGWKWLSASGDGVASIARGRQLYAEHCATCHGALLQGQPDWKSPLPSGRMPAPPHDESGHTWHHSDDVLLRIIRQGPAAVVGAGYESDMPGFGEILSDGDILAVLAFIRGTWPERERNYQAEMSRREREGAQ
jgi:mono/diheme cytochrome c family protein